MANYNLAQKSLEILEVIPNARVRDVIIRRFGLNNKPAETLEAIGQDLRHKITRERVRQIEENGLKILTQPKVLSLAKPIFGFLQDYLIEHGGLRREQKILEELASNNLSGLSSLNSDKADGQAAGAVSLFLTLGPQFHYYGQTEKLHPLWAINKNSLKKSVKLVDFLIRYFNSSNNVIPASNLLEIVKKKEKDISQKVLMSYIDVSKYIDQNNFGQIGLIHWPQIRPRSVRDKAYMVLKHQKQPLHFTEATDVINQHAFDDKKAHVQTVHNELIKDSRFVLIGRGIYALREWGYEPGTVLQVISNMLAKQGPMSKEQIVTTVLKNRLVKENTILINLQNRKLFKQNQEGKYLLA